MPEEIKKSAGDIQVDLDTSGPEVDVTIEETKEEAVVDTAPETTEQETERPHRQRVAIFCVSSARVLRASLRSSGKGW